MYAVLGEREATCIAVGSADGHDASSERIIALLDCAVRVLLSEASDSDTRQTFHTGPLPWQ